jgi:hypothetical protein
MGAQSMPLRDTVESHHHAADRETREEGRENAQPSLSSLLMTAAWGLDPASGIPPREHPFVRQLLRQTVEVVLET